MLILEGIPGAGKTTRLGRLFTHCPERLVLFPEAQPPELSEDNAAMRYLLDEDHARIELARRIEERHPNRMVASDRCHLGVLAYRYAWARLTNQWEHFDHAVTRSAKLQLDERHHDDTLLILHLSTGASLQRRHAADGSQHQPWFDPTFLDAYAEFFTQLDQWTTPGPRWVHHPADDAVGSAISAPLPFVPTASPTIRSDDLSCGRGCGTPRSAIVPTDDAAVQLWSCGLHHQRPGKPVRCFNAANTIAEHTGVLADDRPF